MNVRGIKADAKYVVRNWARSKSMVVITLAMPLILLVAFGFIFDPGATEPPVALVTDADNTNASARFVTLLESQGTVVVANATTGGEGNATHALAAAEAQALLTVPEGFGERWERGENVTVHLVLDTGNAHAARVVTHAVEGALAWFHDEDLTGAWTARVSVDEVRVSEAVPYSSFLLPGVMGFTVLTLGLPLGFTAIVELRHQGLLERLAVSPLTKREWLFARMIGVSAIALLVTTFLVVAAYLVFRTPVSVTPWTLFLVVGGTLVFSGLGTLLGLAVKRLETGGAVLNLVILPMVLLSGLFFDPEILPGFLQWGTYLSPLTYVTHGLRADMLAGDASTAIRYALALFAFAGLLIAFGTRLIKWTDD